MSDGYQTWAEIEAKYPGEWVLLDEPTVDEQDEVVGGKLLAHISDRAEFDTELARHDLTDFAVLHVFDPFAEPILMLPRFYEDEWIEDSTPAETSSSSQPG